MLTTREIARLDTARTRRLHVDVRCPAPLDAELGQRVRDAYGLRRVVVTHAPYRTAVGVRQCVGRAAAELLGDVLTPADTLGLGWAPAVNVTVANLSTLPPIAAVQLGGAVVDATACGSSISMTREVARRSHGRAHVFHAPLVVRTAATACALRRQPEVARVFAQFAHVTTAVVGVVRWRGASSTLYEALEVDDREDMRRRGAHADLSGILLDVHGRLVTGGTTNRMIRISATELRAIPDVIAVAYQRDTASAVRAAIRSTLVNTLVVDAGLARALLRV